MFYSPRGPGQQDQERLKATGPAAKLPVLKVDPYKATAALANVAVFKVNSESERSRWSRFDGSSQGGRFQG